MPRALKEGAPSLQTKLELSTCFSEATSRTGKAHRPSFALTEKHGSFLDMIEPLTRGQLILVVLLLTLSDNRWEKVSIIWRLRRLFLLYFFLWWGVEAEGALERIFFCVFLLSIVIIIIVLLISLTGKRSHVMLGYERLDASRCFLF